MSNEQKFEQIFIDILNVDGEIEKDKQRESYQNWDSLATVTLMTVISSEFGPIVTLEDLEKFNSFNDVLAIIDSRV